MAVQAGLSLAWSQTSKDRFSHEAVHMEQEKASDEEPDLSSFSHACLKDLKWDSAKVPFLVRGLSYTIDILQYHWYWWVPKMLD